MDSEHETPLIAEPPGWFGKLACLGDFASRRLDAATRDAWDGWLSRGLVAWRARDGDGWLDDYLRAPIRFWLQSPERPAACWQAGTWMPSVDSAGRYFPLVVVQALTRAPCGLDDWIDLEARLDDIGQACLATLADPTPSVDRFDEALVRQHAPRGITTSSSVASWALSTMVDQLAASSLWWTGRGQHRVEARWPAGMH